MSQCAGAAPLWAASRGVPPSRPWSGWASRRRTGSGPTARWWLSTTLCPVSMTSSRWKEDRWVTQRESGVVIVLRAKCFLCCRLLMFSTRRMTGFMLSARTTRRDLYLTVTAQLTARSRPRWSWTWRRRCRGTTAASCSGAEPGGGANHLSSTTRTRLRQLRHPPQISPREKVSNGLVYQIKSQKPLDLVTEAMKAH